MIFASSGASPLGSWCERFLFGLSYPGKGMNIYWEIDYTRIVSGLSDPRVPRRLEMASGDIVPVRIYVVERDSIAEPFTTQVLDAAYDIKVAAKLTAAGGTYLIYEDTFEAVVSGDYTYYSGELDLGTAELSAALIGKSAVSVAFEVTLVKNDRNYSTTTIPLRITNDVIDSASLPTAINDNIKLIEGVLHIYNVAQEKWFPVTVGGADGAEHIDLGEGVEA